MNANAAKTKSFRSRTAWNDILRQARRRFGVKELWPGQAELIQHAIAGRDALGILPTGGGKSLCYQLPALFLDGLVVVVSPLIALMQDQHEHLAQADIPAARLDSTVPGKKVRQEEAALRRGDHRIARRRTRSRRSNSSVMTVSAAAKSSTSREKRSRLHSLDVDSGAYWRSIFGPLVGEFGFARLFARL